VAGPLARAARGQPHLPPRTDLRRQDGREVRAAGTEAVTIPSPGTAVPGLSGLSMSRIRDALEQIDFARRYTRERIASVPLSEWFTIPPGGVSNIAWQVGHITMAEYRLCLERLRPRTAADAELMPDQ